MSDTGQDSGTATYEPADTSFMGPLSQRLTGLTFEETAEILTCLLERRPEYRRVHSVSLRRSGRDDLRDIEQWTYKRELMRSKQSHDLWWQDRALIWGPNRGNQRVVLGRATHHQGIVDSIEDMMVHGEETAMVALKFRRFHPVHTIGKPDPGEVCTNKSESTVQESG
jgi:hypothetical protein